MTASRLLIKTQVKSKSQSWGKRLRLNVLHCPHPHGNLTDACFVCLELMIKCPENAFLCKRGILLANRHLVSKIPDPIRKQKSRA